jgi:dTDP-4-amino-4,6-dideoxygalactose transaminase
LKNINFLQTNKKIEQDIFNIIGKYSGFSEMDLDDLTKEFNSKFSEFTSSKFIIPTTTGTSALHLAVCAIDLKRGDKVICSVNSSPEIPEVVRHFDAEPIFIDIKKGSYQMDSRKIEELLINNSSKKIKAIIISHTAGEITDLEKIKKISQNRNIKIIEEATQILGFHNQSKNIADIQFFNLVDSSKTAISNLGIFATNNEDLFDRAQLLSNHGIVVDKKHELEYIYDVIDIGCQYRAGKLELLFGLSKLKTLLQSVQNRIKIAKFYSTNLKDIPHIYISDFSKRHSYFYFIIKVDKNRDHFAQELLKRGIKTGLHYIPLHLLDYYKNKYSLRINDFPNALKNFQQILSIPIHDSLTKDDILYVVQEIGKIAENRI